MLPHQALAHIGSGRAAATVAAVSGAAGRHAVYVCFVNLVSWLIIVSSGGGSELGGGREAHPPIVRDVCAHALQAQVRVRARVHIALVQASCALGTGVGIVGDGDLQRVAAAAQSSYAFALNLFALHCVCAMGADFAAVPACASKRD